MVFFIFYFGVTADRVPNGEVNHSVLTYRFKQRRALWAVRRVTALGSLPSVVGFQESITGAEFWVEMVQNKPTKSSTNIQSDILYLNHP